MMDFKQIQELIRMVSKSNISEITIEEQEFRIKIKTGSSNPVYIESVQHQVPQLAAQPIPNQMQQPLVEKIVATEDEAIKKQDIISENNNYITIKSPIVGTFYRTAGPDKEPFVKIGDELKIGTVTCIIEAMKLFNEIESEVAGKIVKILVEDKTPVEYDQPLFLIEPK